MNENTVYNVLYSYNLTDTLDYSNGILILSPSSANHLSKINTSGPPDFNCSSILMDGRKDKSKSDKITFKL